MLIAATSMIKTVMTLDNIWDRVFTGASRFSFCFGLNNNISPSPLPIANNMIERAKKAIRIMAVILTAGKVSHSLILILLGIFMVFSQFVDRLQVPVPPKPAYLCYRYFFNV